MKAKDCSKLSLETIKALTEMADEVETPSEEEPKADEENPKPEESAEEEEPKADEGEPEEESRKPAKLQSRSVFSEKAKDVFEGYVISSEDAIGGVAFYKHY